MSQLQWNPGLTDRQGIEIDYCPNCRGIWLDKGELDKIIERSALYSNTANDHQAHHPYTAQGYHDANKNDPYYNKYKKRKGFLGDLFDFD